MRNRIASLFSALVPLCLAALLLPLGAAAAPPPSAAWKVALTPMPANLAPGSEVSYLVVATDVGGGGTQGQPLTLAVDLPASVTPTKVTGLFNDPSAAAAPQCTLDVATTSVTCASSEELHPGRLIAALVTAEVAAGAAEETAVAQASIIGGGAAQPGTTSVSTPISSSPLGFGFLPGFSAPATEADGSPGTLAGSHPYQMTVDLNFPTAQIGRELTGAGHPRDIVTELPRGLVGDPAALPVLCTEAELTTEQSPGCPPASQVGLVDLTTSLGERGNGSTTATSNLYAMVPPPGAPAAFAFDAVGAGIFIHLIAAVGSDGTYRIYTSSEDLLALPTHPIFNIQAQLWGDPSATEHDQTRGTCQREGGFCSVPAQPGAFLTLPASCPGTAPVFTARADSWEEPGVFHETGYEASDLEGNPVSISGCNALRYEPTLSAAPTTNLADSPTGLDVDLHQPQDFGKDHTATAELRDAGVTLPPGLVANPSQADGLKACSEAEIGYLPPSQEAGIHFSKAPQSCPDAAKIGTMEVTTPLLAQYRNNETEPATDPETGLPIPRPLPGSVYLAQPFANPFGSLLAIYLAVEDPRSGTVAKLAGRVIPDPQTGRLTTVFDENPQLPLEDIKLELFGGARASLTSPPVCGIHTTTTTLAPWSDSEGGVPIAGADAHPQSSFETTASPAGGACPTEEAKAPHVPAFQAGTVSPQAGAYSPFVLRLSREDGSQRLTGIDTVLPPGLTGKLAGIEECSAAGLAQAASREAPDQGIVEKEHPSCPASSEVGTVDVAAGSGPAPFHTTGRAYLAGPYKGAPLSLAIVTPAIAGPFDLGTVVVRTALFVDPFTAQIHAVSDPFPQILDGIPLDLRSVAVSLARPGFTLNPTSCEPLAITGQATSALGQSAPLTQRFQVGGCSSLGFRPSLTLKLKGGTRRSQNPSLTARLTYPRQGAYANIASAQVNLPHSEFLEQGHIRTVCTRPQLASHTCPQGSIYGFAKAVTPLLDKPLEGPVYLGVGFGHQLPDLVADLNGQIEVLLHGKTDTGKNHGLRNTFQVVPDAPVSSFSLTLFGGKRGLIVNSENLCGPHAKRQAFAHFTAQNGAVLNLKPKVQNQCGGKKGKKKRHGGRHHRR